MTPDNVPFLSHSLLVLLPLYCLEPFQLFLGGFLQADLLMYVVGGVGEAGKRVLLMYWSEFCKRI